MKTKCFIQFKKKKNHLIKLFKISKRINVQKKKNKFTNMTKTRKKQFSQLEFEKFRFSGFFFF